MSMELWTRELELMKRLNDGRGSAIAKIVGESPPLQTRSQGSTDVQEPVGQNVNAQPELFDQEVRMWCFEEQVRLPPPSTWTRLIRTCDRYKGGT